MTVTPQTMLINTARFGVVEVSPILFPEGLVGFEDHTNWALMEHGGRVAFQSCHDASTWLAVAPARACIPDYPVHDDTVLLVLNFVDGKLCCNARGPIIIDTDTWTGRQTVLPSDRFALRHPVPQLQRGTAP